ncbi:MAG: hypothetical protein M3P51_08420 [Chloroflexota bacterium]|nr:hypothetical protein [Chloroflexota bacterium]
MIVHMIGNAHIDPVWLWRWQEGVDEALATFRSAADRCDEYPAFIFTRGEAWLYKQIELIDPELFERVRRLIEHDQWHVTGGQYIQPDSNLPTEMGWRRQFLHGQRYFQDRFGVSPQVAYNVDSFGHPATLPDILASLEYLGFVFHRPGPHQVALPAQTFRWKGVGGGEVLGFRIIPSYTTQTDDLHDRVMQAVEAADPSLGHTMCFYGVGNHGGGPTKGNIEYILEHMNPAPGVELRFSTPQSFFEAVAAKREVLPEVTEELQKTFPGCYSVMHDIKQAQIRGEHLLDQAERVVERWADEPERKTQYHSRLDSAWEDLLLTEFHDILAGTSIPSAWRSVRALQGRAWIDGEETVLEATRRWARSGLPPVAEHQQLVILNPDLAMCEGTLEAEPWLDFDSWGGRWLSDLDGNPVPFQQVQPEAQVGKSRIAFPFRVEAGGAVQILVRDDPRPQTSPIPSDLQVSPQGLSNSHLRLGLESWGIHSLEVGGRHVLGANGWRLHLRHDHTDTWTFHTDRFTEPVHETLSAEGWVVEEEGPLRARVRLTGRLGDSSLRWTLTLCRDDPRLYIQLECNFDERFKILQMPIELESSPAHWTDGLAAGQVEHTANPTEWPVQGWSRVSVGGKQLALITSDAYSLSMPGDVWQWTLLRSPKMAWMGGESEVYAGRDWHTDQGAHTFEFILYAGDELGDEALRTAGRQQAQPPIVFGRYEGLDRPRREREAPPETVQPDTSGVQ